MIVNVISSGITESTSNVFAGMSLAEACGQLQANVSDALNEMNMSILLNEHLYLRENGEDITYANEGAMADLKSKITGAIDKVISQVSQMWDKLVSWVQDRVEDVVWHLLVQKLIRIRQSLHAIRILKVFRLSISLLARLMT